MAMAAGVSGVMVSIAGINSDPEAVQGTNAIHNLRLMNALIPAGSTAAWLFIRSLKQLRVFVSRSRHKNS